MTTSSGTNWSDFARDAWERRAVAKNGEFAEIIDAMKTAMFTALVTASEEWRARAPEPKFCFWIDGAKQERFDELLPYPEDAGFDEYDRRVRRQLSGAEYTMLLAEPHTFFPEVWAQCSRIARLFLKHTQLPNGWLDTAIFLGSYRTTPFGVHQGPMSVFTVPLIGKKTFRLWSPEYVAANQSIVNTMEYEEHKPGSYLLSAAPGGYIYWPSREWHLAECDDGAFTAALSIGIWCNPSEQHPLWSVAKLVEKMLANAPFEALKACDKPFVTGGIVDGVLPESLEHFVRQLEDYVASGRLRTEVAGMLVQQMSTFGFKTPPRRTATDVPGTEQRLRREHMFPIVATPTAAGELAIAANGHAFAVPDLPEVRHLLRVVDAQSETFTPSFLARASAIEGFDGLDVEEVCSILAPLLAAECLRKVK